ATRPDRHGGPGRAAGRGVLRLRSGVDPGSALPHRPVGDRRLLLRGGGPLRQGGGLNVRRRRFGQTALAVPQPCPGTMVLTDPGETRRIIDAYADAGGNVLDTASAYGDGEELLGSVLERRDRFVLATKYTLSRDASDPNGAGNHRKNLVLSLERSL